MAIPRQSRPHPEPPTAGPGLHGAVAGPRGRGCGFNPPNRFEQLHVEPDPDCPPDEQLNPRTRFFVDASESLLTKNDSPDVAFTWGLNAYRGCEHGCAYCYARHYHEYLGWGSGLDFESRIMVKTRAPELLRRELGSKRWRPERIGMSGVTDCYQPAERHFRLTRQCLEVCAELRQPIAIITKNALVTRDIDLFVELAKYRCVSVNLSITTLDADLCGRLEPRASRPQARLGALRALRDAGVPAGVMFAPCIPGLTEHEMPALLEAAAKAGATRAGYLMLRLPHSVKDVFGAWLDQHEPGKKARVLDRLRQLHAGQLYRSDWNTRNTGQGLLAEQLQQLFNVTCRRVGLSQDHVELSTEHFRGGGGRQLELGL